MLVVNDIKIQEFCKKNKLKFNRDVKFYKATRNNAKSKNNLIINLENLKDYMKQKDSGIDEVFCKIIKETQSDFALWTSSKAQETQSDFILLASSKAQEGQRQIFFDLNELLKSEHPERIIPRIKQNIKLFKKYKIQYDFAYVCESTEKIISEKDISALLRVLENNSN